MKSLLLKAATLFLMVAMVSCNEEETLKPLSRETGVEDITINKEQTFAKVRRSDNEITISITRNSPENIDLSIKLAEGAKIEEVAEGLVIEDDQTINVPLELKTYYFRVKAENGETTQRYNLTIERDKVDISLEIIEQVLLWDKSSIWNHIINEDGTVTASQKINAVNNQKLTTFTHKVDEQGFVTETAFTNFKHEQYTYRWKYEDEQLVKYDVRQFNRTANYYDIATNDENKIEKLIKKNQFDYVLQESTFKYDEKGRLIESTETSPERTYSFQYDEMDRIVSTSKYNFKFDDRGNVIERENTDELGLTYKWTHDEKGNMTSETVFRKNGTSGDVFSFTHYENGRFKESHNADNSTTFTYDEDGAYEIKIEEPSYTFTTSYNPKHLPVRKYNEYQYDNSKLIMETVEEYNEHQLKTKSTLTTTSELRGTTITTTELKYNNEKQLIEKREYKDDALTALEKSVYNQDGLKIQTHYFDKEEKPTKDENFEYAAYGKVSKKTTVDLETNSRSEESFTYNEYGHNSQIITKKYDNNELVSEVIVDYYTDLKQKKREETKIFTNGQLTSHRVIVYRRSGSMLSEDILV